MAQVTVLDFFIGDPAARGWCRLIPARVTGTITPVEGSPSLRRMTFQSLCPCGTFRRFSWYLRNIPEISIFLTIATDSWIGERAAPRSCRRRERSGPTGPPSFSPSSLHASVRVTCRAECVTRRAAADGWGAQERTSLASGSFKPRSHTEAQWRQPFPRCGARPFAGRLQNRSGRATSGRRNGLG